MEEWKEYKLGEVCTKIGSGATPKGGKEAYLGGDTSLIRSQNVLDFSFSWDGLAYINDEQASKLNGVELEQNDVLLNITGDSVARACIVPDEALPARVNQHVAIIRGDQSIVLNDYILYYLQFKKQYLLSLSQGGATRNALTKGMIEELEIPLPTLNKQKEIVSILKSLDDKIGVNRKINENLEQQAQALFKSWFVDFEPFKDGEFVESELGMIPKGWRVCSADEVFDINIGKTPPRKEPEWFTESKEDNVWVSIADMGSCGVFISDSSEYLTDEAIKRFNVLMVEKDSVLLSFKLTVGRVAIADTRLTTNEAIARFILPDKCYREFLYLYLKQYKYENLGSTSSIATAVNSKTIKGMKIIVPPTDIIKSFSNNARPLFEQIRSLQQESRRLATLRDTLLPKLMSGELKVNDMRLSEKQ